MTALLPALLPGEPVDVRTDPVDGVQTPTQLLRQGRLWLVRSVEQHPPTHGGGGGQRWRVRAAPGPGVEPSLLELELRDGRWSVAEPVGSGSAAPAAPAGLAGLARARATLAEAAEWSSEAERYRGAQAAALQVAAVVLAARARPAPGARRRNAWRLLATVAPELAEWAAFFAAAGDRCEQLRTATPPLVSRPEVEDFLASTGDFLAIVEHALSPPGPPGPPLPGSRWTS